MHPKYPRVFDPIKIGPVELRNRFYSSPHGMPMAIGGKPTDDYLHYNLARAKGGVGLLMSSLTIPDRSRGAQPSPEPAENVEAFRAVVDAVHGAGAKIFGEPFYQWCAPGTWHPFTPQAPMFSPSISQFRFLDRRASTREISTREIKEILAALRRAVTNLRAAGYDGIMVHASHGTLVEQFLSPYYNRRTDEYGGSLDNRMRFLIQQLETVRELAEGKMAVGMRLNCDELFDGGNHTKDAYQILKKITDAGLIDFVDLDIAVEPDQFHLGMPPVFAKPHLYRPYVEAVRGAAGKVPVLSVLGRMTSIADAEAALTSGVCDLVGAARALIAEPDLVNNAFNGKENRSRTCIACNSCMSAMFEGAHGCAINPSSYRERFWGPQSFTPAAKRSKVVIVGAGPGGLEAARVATLRGHDVVMFEARDKVGGAFALWAKLPGREFYQKALDWWESELKQLGVKLCLGTTATAESVLAEKPDAVIIATGAHYCKAGHSNFIDTDIPGHDQSIVCMPEDILLGKVRPTGKVIVLDAEGTHGGAGIAETLARAGCDVELLTPYLSPMGARLTDTQDAHFIIKRLHDVGVKLSPMTYIKRIGGNEVTVYNVHSDQERVVTGVNAVVLSTGRVPVNALERDLDGKVAQLFTIGDALAARQWSAATFEGQRFARFIGEPNAPISIDDIYFSPDDLTFVPFPADVPRPQ
jgi:2,4-dienoyl-CoA reductase-like NADH-dependent reductase (Old Yellow Enzyme family)